MVNALIGPKAFLALPARQTTVASQLASSAFGAGQRRARTAAADGIDARIHRGQSN